MQSVLDPIENCTGKSLVAVATAMKAKGEPRLWSSVDVNKYRSVTQLEGYASVQIFCTIQTKVRNGKRRMKSLFLKLIG